MAKVTKAAKKAKIVEMLDKSDAAVCRALVSIYERQTAEEKASAVTVNDNGVGFSGCDAEFGTSLAQKIMKGWTMSPKQIAAGRRMIKRYWAQLIEVADAKNPGWAGEDVAEVVAKENAEAAAIAEAKATADAAKAKFEAAKAEKLARIAEQNFSLYEMIEAAEAAVVEAATEGLVVAGLDEAPEADVEVAGQAAYGAMEAAQAEMAAEAQMEADYYDAQFEGESRSKWLKEMGF